MQNSSTDRSAAQRSRAGHRPRAPREPSASLCFSLGGLYSCPLLRKGRFDDGGQGGAFLQEGVVPVNGIDFDELTRAVEARGQGLHVAERHQLVLAYRNQ